MPYRSVFEYHCPNQQRTFQHFQQLLQLQTANCFTFEVFGAAQHCLSSHEVVAARCQEKGLLAEAGAGAIVVHVVHLFDLLTTELAALASFDQSGKVHQVHNSITVLVGCLWQGTMDTVWSGGGYLVICPNRR